MFTQEDQYTELLEPISEPQQVPQNDNTVISEVTDVKQTSGTQTDRALVYDSDGSAEVHNYENCYDNEIFNMFTQEEQYTKLLEPIPEPHQVPQNDNNVIFEVSSVEQSGGTVEQHHNVGNLNRYNDIQNVGNQVIQNEVQNPRIQNVRNKNGLIGVPGNVNQNPNRNGNLVAARAEVRPRKRDAAYLQTQLLIAQKEEAGIQLQAEEFDLMAIAADLDEIEEVNANSGFENRPPMLNKENYVSWSSRLLWYAKSRPNGKLIHNSIINGPYVRRMIPEPDIYATVDSCETAQEIWLRVQQMMKGSDIGIQEKKAKLFNEWERNQVAQNPRVQNIGNQNGLIGVPGNANLNGNGNLVAADAEGNATGHNGNQIRCYNCRGVDLDEIEEVNANCILMANLQQASTSGTQTNKAPIYDSDGSAEPEWSRHVTIVHQTKDLHTSDYTQLYDFLKYNQKEVDELKAKRLVKIQDHLALMANSNNPYAFPAPHQDQPSYN
nr:hypothetical protein [Tanacetum cinerariifolium]